MREMADMIPRITCSRKNNYYLEEKRSCPWLETFCAFAASISFFILGAGRAYTSPAIISMQHDKYFNQTLTSNDISWIASSPPLGAFTGALLSAPLLQFVGRQKTLVILSFPYLVGYLLIGFALNVTMVLIGRVLTGIAAGLSIATAQLYISEFARRRIRGVLGFLPGMMVSIGVLMGFIIGASTYWRLSAFIMCAFPVILFLFVMPLPESPTWLLMKKRESEAMDSFQKIRGSGRDVELRAELDEIKENLEEVKKAMSEVSWGELLLSQEIYWPLFLAVSLMILQSFTGINAIVYYLEYILGDTQRLALGHGMILTAHEGALTVGIVQVLAFFISLPLIDCIGRRVLLLASSIIMGIAHLLLGSYFYACEQNHEEFVIFTASWLPLTALCVFVAAYSVGFAAIPYIITSEIFPSHLRSLLCAFCTCTNLLSTFIVVRYFPILQEAMYPGYIFFLFAIFCGISCLVVLFSMPETKGKTLVEIQQLFADNIIPRNFNNNSIFEHVNISLGNKHQNGRYE